MTTQSLKEDARPAQQWYWDTWFSSHDVQSCGMDAQGLWINMLGIMFVSEIRGTLTINGIQMDNKSIAKRFRLPLKEVNKLITELENQQVFSRLEDGTIISRRMHRDSKRKEELSRIRAKAGKKGMQKRWKQTDNKDDNKPITNITASSLTPTLSSTSSSKNTCDQAELDRLFEKWFKRYPRTNDRGKAKSKWLNLVANEGIDPQELEDALTGYINYLHAEGTNDLKYVKHAKTFLYNGNKKKKIDPTWKPYVKYADQKYKQRPEL